jgi:protein-disulfide isomerase
MRIAALAIPFLLVAMPVAAQQAIPPTNATPFRDTSMLKPPAGAKVAIIEFEDLECSACAHVSPIVRAAMERYKIPRVHYDFIVHRVWSRAAAINARYLEDKISPKLAEDYRADVFANQTLIANQDDLQHFTRTWFQAHHQQLPFVVDPYGRCTAEVQADCTLGERLKVMHTPTIIVVTKDHWIEVTDPSHLYTAIDVAEASVREPSKATPAKRN